MPMNRSLYPPNWGDIAKAVKDAAGWTCQDCGKPCRKPGESVESLTERLADSFEWSGELWEEYHDEETGEWGYVPKPQRFCLTVAHLNHQPEDCRRENLRALCAPCHLRYDGGQMTTKKRLKAERLGQLSII